MKALTIAAMIVWFAVIVYGGDPSYFRNEIAMAISLAGIKLSLSICFYTAIKLWGTK